MFFDDHGLLNSRPDEKNAENSFLWSVEYLFELIKKGKPYNEIESDISQALDNMRIGTGLYKQNPGFPHPSVHNHKDAYMSHDQLTAIVCFLLHTKQKSKIKEIFQVFIKQRGQYDNVSPDNPGSEKKRYYHPRDLAFYYLASLAPKDMLKPWTWLLAPIAVLIVWLGLFATFVTPYKYRQGQKILKTDGILLHRIRHHVMSVIYFPINWFAELIVKFRFGNWQGVYATYFTNPQHPIRRLIDDTNI